MAEGADPNQIFRKRKAISALIPYAVCVARRDGQQQMVNGFLRVARASNQNSGEFIWHRVGRYITPLFNKPMTPSSNSVIILASSHVHWLGQLDETVVTGWAAVASETPYTEEIGQKVVDTLLRIAYFDSLRPHGDIEILKSYFLVVWSEWDPIEYYVGPSTQRRYGGLREMRTSIQEDFGGIGVGRHREDLINRLDYILGQLHLGLEYLKPRKPSLEDNSVQEAKEQYGELKKLLLEVEGKAVNILTRTSPRSILFGLLTPLDTYRIPLNLRVCFTSPVSMILHSSTWHYLHRLTASSEYQLLLLSCLFTSLIRLCTTLIYLDVRYSGFPAIGGVFVAPWLSRCL